MTVTAQKIRDAVIGAAVGDAVGVPYEFSSPEQMVLRPAKDMVGGGSYGLPAGTWSDDTSMILCTLDTLDERLDYNAVMTAFLNWYKKGDYTPYGNCFDIGNTTSIALYHYSRFHDPLDSGLDDEYSNGNGSLMRIIPAALYAASHALTLQDAISLSHTLSRLTHAHLRSQMGCGIFTCVALALLETPGKSSVRDGLAQAGRFYADSRYDGERSEYERVFSEKFFDLPASEIQSSGYVVTTLECALWCLMNTDNFRDCILRTVNFGRDTDTAACVAGALAGLLYGAESIPENWRGTLARTDLIENVIQTFCMANGIA